jgi:hypothetical protein
MAHAMMPAPQRLYLLYKSRQTTTVETPGLRGVQEIDARSISGNPLRRASSLFCGLASGPLSRCSCWPLGLSHSYVRVIHSGSIPSVGTSTSSVSFDSTRVRRPKNRQRVVSARRGLARRFADVFLMNRRWRAILPPKKAESNVSRIALRAAYRAVRRSESRCLNCPIRSSASDSTMRFFVSAVDVQRLFGNGEILWKATLHLGCARA